MAAKSAEGQGTCSICGGAQSGVCPGCDGVGQKENGECCPTCHGTGEVVCSFCNGTGAKRPHPPKKKEVSRVSSQQRIIRRSLRDV